jgi:hypothetical protein
VRHDRVTSVERVRTAIDTDDVIQKPIAAHVVWKDRQLAARGQGDLQAVDGRWLLAGEPLVEGTIVDLTCRTGEVVPVGVVKNAGAVLTHKGSLELAEILSLKPGDRGASPASVPRRAVAGRIRLATTRASRCPSPVICCARVVSPTRTCRGSTRCEPSPRRRTHGYLLDQHHSSLVQVLDLLAPVLQRAEPSGRCRGRLCCGHVRHAPCENISPSLVAPSVPRPRWASSRRASARSPRRRVS